MHQLDPIENANSVVLSFNDLRSVLFLTSLSYDNQFMGHWENCVSVIGLGKLYDRLLFLKNQYKLDFGTFKACLLLAKIW